MLSAIWCHGKTTHVLIRFVEEITTAIENILKKNEVAVFLDLKKAFDTVDHNLLIKKRS